MNENVTYVNKESIKRLASQKLSFMINEEVQKGASKEEIEELVRQFHECVSELIRHFDEQKEKMEAARRDIEKQQYYSTIENGGITR